MQPRDKLLSLYKRMLAEYGPQGWWPADSRFEVVAGALLTQNTNWTNVEKAIANLKDAGMLDPEKIIIAKNSKTRMETLESLIRPSGFYRQKAQRLVLLTEKYLDILGRKPGIDKTSKTGKSPNASDSLRDELLSVKGVGPETADSILLYAFDLPHFVIDAYTRRFCTHHRLCDMSGRMDYGHCKVFFEANLPRSVPLYKEYHALIVEWGKRNRDRGKEKRIELRYCEAFFYRFEFGPG